MLQVFIDTNVYLTFYSLASEDLEELRKLHTAVQNGALRLVVPEQVHDELERNRETRFAESLKHVRDLRPAGGLPAMARDLPEAAPALEAQRTFVQRVGDLESRLTELFDRRELDADKVLAELLDAAGLISTTDDVLEAARRRVEVGSPPGKRSAVGDALNWETLLSEAAQDTLHLVTGDGDYVSVLAKDRVKPYLVREWEERKGGEVRLYRRISDFLRQHFPDIKVATELEKEIRLQALIDSGSFDSTHRAISRLRQYTEFTPQQAADLLEAAVENTQIRWIAADSDVQEFYRDLLGAHPGAAQGARADILHELLEN